MHSPLRAVSLLSLFAHSLLSSRQPRQCHKSARRPLGRTRWHQVLSIFPLRQSLLHRIPQHPHRTSSLSLPCPRHPPCFLSQAPLRPPFSQASRSCPVLPLPRPFPLLFPPQAQPACRQKHRA